MNPVRNKTRPRTRPDAPMASWFFTASGMESSDDRTTDDTDIVSQLVIMSPEDFSEL